MPAVPTPTVRRTSTRLADGRELTYFDDSEPYVSGAATRRLDDPRPLPDRFAPIPSPTAPSPLSPGRRCAGTRSPVTGSRWRVTG